MSHSIRSAALFCLVARYCAAQTGGYAMNAVGSVSSQANVLAPAMLATVTETPQTLSVIVSTSPPPAGPTFSASVFVRQIGATAEFPATVVNAGPGAVTFIAPPIPYGPAELAWEINGEPYRWINVVIAPTNFELARIAPTGPALAQVLYANGSSTPVGLATPAQPGQTVSLSGSGLGSGVIPHATLGGLPATLLFAGRGAAAGYDQIKIQVPAGIADSCYSPLVLIAGTSTAVSTISVTSDGSPCKHPFNLSVGDMKTLDSGGTLAVGEIDLNTSFEGVSSSAASRQESAGVNVGEQTATDLARYFTPVGATGACTAFAQVPTYAVLVAGQFIATSAPIPAPPSLGNSTTLQNSATTLNLAGSGGYSFSATLPPPQDGTPTSPPPPVLAGGKWTWSSPGSPDLAPSSFVFALPAPLQLIGGAPLSLSRALDQTIGWNGAGFDAAATVTAFLTGRAGSASGSLQVTCTAPAQAGIITIPAALLSPFAPSSIATLTAEVNWSGPTMPHTLLETKSGATLLLVVSYTTGDNRPVDFQ